MSAMHWEARRRQSALDRRTARDKLQLLQKDSETSCNASEPNSTQEETAAAQCPTCQDNLKTSVHLSAKVPNRYSSSQYTQQW